MSTKIRIFTLLLVSPLLAHSLVSAEDSAKTPETLDWQERMLLYPTPSQLSTEQDGRITIYDSLEYGLVNDALDLHFDRIQNMMFVRIHHLPPAGAGPADVESDGCD